MKQRARTGDVISSNLLRKKFTNRVRKPTRRRAVKRTDLRNAFKTAILVDNLFRNGPPPPWLCDRDVRSSNYKTLKRSGKNSSSRDQIPFSMTKHVYARKYHLHCHILQCCYNVEYINTKKLRRGTLSDGHAEKLYTTNSYAVPRHYINSYAAPPPRNYINCCQIRTQLQESRKTFTANDNFQSQILLCQRGPRLNII